MPTDILQDPARPVPTEVPSHDGLLKEPAKDSACTHHAVRETQHNNIMAEHQPHNLIAAENAAV